MPPLSNRLTRRIPVEIERVTHVINYAESLTSFDGFNEIRGFLLERGITFAANPVHLRKNLPIVIEDADQNPTPRLRWLLDGLWQEWKQVELDIKAMTEEIERISKENRLCRRLRQLPRRRV
jgi:hypothetical protein